MHAAAAAICACCCIAGAWRTPDGVGMAAQGLGSSVLRHAVAATARGVAAAPCVRSSGVSRPSPRPCKYIIRVWAQARASSADACVLRRRAVARVCAYSLPSFPHTGMHRFGATQLSVFLGKSVNASELRNLGSRGQ
eukprot:358762-Chlamydomonas_euryale.AAC.1